MKKLFRCILPAFLSILIFSFGADVAFASSTSVDNYNENELIAIGAPKAFGYDYDWTIVKETALYDTNDNIIAYCYDLANCDYADDMMETAYTVVNATSNGSVILMLGINGISPYFANDYEKAYFFGALEYYGENDGEIINITTEDIINKTTLTSICSSYLDLTHEASSKAQTENIRSYLTNVGKGIISDNELLSANLKTIGNVTTNTGTVNSPNDDWTPTTARTNMITGVPCLDWYRGCAPTSVAMMIMARSPYLDSTQLIDDLADFMGTRADGSTSFPGISSGTYNYLTVNNIGSPGYCNWASTRDDGVPYVGFAYNRKEVYEISINMGCPVGVYVSSSTVVTPSYSNMGAHMMAGVGYLFDSDLETLLGDYIICNTTSARDGSVLFPMTTSALNNVAWFLIFW